MSKLSSIDNYNKPFPSTLRKLIERKNTTIQAVAKHIGVSRQAVSQYQDGSTQPNADTIVKMAEFFNVSTDYLLTGKSKSIDESFNIACDTTGLSEKAVELLHTCKPEFLSVLNGMLENFNFWALVGKIEEYRKFKKLADPLEKWLLGMNDIKVDEHASNDTINIRDFRLFQIQKLIKTVAEEDIENG